MSVSKLQLCAGLCRFLSDIFFRFSCNRLNCCFFLQPLLCYNLEITENNRSKQLQDYFMEQYLLFFFFCYHLVSY